MRGGEMDAAQIAVTAGGAAVIGFIVWFFFGPRRGRSATPTG